MVKISFVRAAKSFLKPGKVLSSSGPVDERCIWPELRSLCLVSSLNSQELGRRLLLTPPATIEQGHENVREQDGAQLVLHSAEHVIRENV